MAETASGRGPFKGSGRGGRRRMLLRALVALSLFMGVLVFAAGGGDREKPEEAQEQAASDQAAGQNETVRWQYAPVSQASPAASGFDGLSFTGGSAEDPEAAFFCLTKDSESGICYGYVPAEMTGALRLRMHEDEQLVIRETQAQSASGDGQEPSRYDFVEASVENSVETENSAKTEDAAEIGVFRSGEKLPLFEEGRHYEFTILDGEGQPTGSEDAVFLYSENVPSMYVETQSGSIAAVDADKKHETSEPAAYRIYLTNGQPDSGGQCVIKGRGNSTWSQEKRPYNLNLASANILLGMDPCKKYALIANYWDSVQTRQYFAYLAAGRLGLEYTPQTQFVNLYLNGRYQSLYLLTQRLNVNGGTVAITNLDKANKKANKKQLAALAKAAEEDAQEIEDAKDGESASQSADKKAQDGENSTQSADQDARSVKNTAQSADQAAQDGKNTADLLPETVVMDDDGKGNEALAYAWENDPDNISGGYLLEFQDRYKKEEVWFRTDKLHISFKAPETPSRGEYEYISGYVREAEAALYADDWKNAETGLSCFDYFDMDSWARMYLIQDFFVQSDDEYYSFFFYKKTDDPLLYCGPVWDFDLCLGNMNCGDYYKTSAQTLWLKDGRKRWLHRMGKNPAFKKLLTRLYLEELEPLMRDILEKEYDPMASRLKKVTALNYLRWHKNLDYKDRVSRVRDLIGTRTDFLHDYYTDPSQFHRLLFHFAWGDFSYYVKDGEAMGFLPTAEYGEKQSSPQRKGNGTIAGWQDAEDGTLLSPDEPIREDRAFDPVYEGN